MAIRKLLTRAGAIVGLSIWLAGQMAVILWFVLTMAFLPRPLAWASLALQVAAVLAPLHVPPPAFIRRFLEFSVRAAIAYFPITIQFEDQEAFKEGTAYLIGYEPHAVLPLALGVFTTHSRAVPPPLRAYVMGTSVIFLEPLMRHMCWWLGIRPANKDEIKRNLAAGHSCALCPGGVQECLYMQEGAEVVFLRKRTGFIRVALETGSPLVPIFAFGTRHSYSYIRPFIDIPKKVPVTPEHPVSRLARKIGYLPLLAWGVLGSAMPRATPTHVVVGRPIPVPKVADPTPEQVQDYLDKFIAATEELFHGHKAAAGCPGEQLLVY